MHWNRSNAIGLAKASCKTCRGQGMRSTEHRSGEKPCNCIFRAVFRACYNRFRACAAGSQIGTVSLEFCYGPEGRQTYARKREEFMADFCLVSRRTLNEFEYKLFRYHFLLGADWKLCSRQLKMDRGNVFHAIYRIQQKLGRAFAELQPYALYPPEEYFGGVIARRAPRSTGPSPETRPSSAPRFTLPLSA